MPVATCPHLRHPKVSTSSTNNTYPTSDGSDIHSASNHEFSANEDYEYLSHSPTPPTIDPLLTSSSGPIIPVPPNSPLSQAEVYSLRAHELAEANLLLQDADPTIPSREISSIHSKLFTDLQKRGLSWEDNYTPELFRLGVLVSFASSPPRKKPK